MKILVCSLLIICQSFTLTIVPTMRDKLQERANPVHWAYSAKKIDQSKYEIHLTATMDAGWHIYAGNQPKEAIAIPTKIKFSLNPLVRIIGKLNEIGKKEKQEVKEAGIVQYAYGGTVDFMQIISVKSNIKTNISGKITYQACTDEMCLSVKTASFSLSLN